jgi:hypothetical protein
MRVRPIFEVMQRAKNDIVGRTEPFEPGKLGRDEVKKRGVDIGEKLRTFKRETSEMSSVMKGLAIACEHWIREAHNSLAR